MSFKRLLTTIMLLVVGVALVLIPYRVHIAGDTGDLRSVTLGLLPPLCLLAIAAFIALGGPVGGVQVITPPPPRAHRKKVAA
jgi:hypothetical protein